MPNSEYAAFKALDPFFEVVQKGLSRFVDGEHYFDTIAEDALFEFRYHFPGYPHEVRGRANLMALYSGYGDSIELHRGDALVVHPSKDGRVAILECEVHGTIVATGARYDNRLRNHPAQRLSCFDDIVKYRNYITAELDHGFPFARNMGCLRR